MLADLVASGTDFLAAKVASFPSEAAFQRCLAAGGIRKPMREVLKTNIDNRSRLGHYLLECFHAMPIASANKVRHPEPGKPMMRPCMHCARERFVKKDPNIAVEYARWVHSQLDAQRSSELAALEPQRHSALSTALQRFSMAMSTAERRAKHAADTGLLGAAAA